MVLGKRIALDIHPIVWAPLGATGLTRTAGFLDHDSRGRNLGPRGNRSGILKRISPNKLKGKIYLTEYEGNSLRDDKIYIYPRHQQKGRCWLEKFAAQ